MKNKIHYILLIIVLLVGFFFRFYKLGEVPNGFYQDESAIGYNAYSIIHTGKDEHGQTLPLYFKSFGDYKLPVYIYATIPAIQLFGMTEFAVRFPSALFGFLTLIVMYLFVRELTDNKNLALVATAFMAINPWSLDYNRATFEVSISLFLFVLGAWLIILSYKRKIPGMFLIGTLCFILDIYTYNLTRLLSPLLYIVCVASFFKKRTVSKKEYIITFILCIIALVPFIKTIFGQGGISSAGGTLLFSSAVVRAPMIEMKSYLANNPLVSRILLSMPVQMAWQYILNIFSYLSIPFFFISGSTHGNHGIGNVGQFYVFELLFMIVGIVVSIQKKYSWRNFIFAWAILTILVAALTRDIPQATRSFFLILPLEMLSAVGIITTYEFLIKIKSPIVKYVSLGIGAIIIVYAVSYYFASYYGRFPIAYAKAWRQQDKALSLYLKENQQKYDKIIIDTNSGFIYSSLLFFQQYSPQDFQKTAVWTPDDSEGMSSPISFGKYELRNIDWSKDLASPRTLIITTTDKKPENVAPLASFAYPTRPVVIADKQEIIAYPVTDYAYVAVETK